MASAPLDRLLDHLRTEPSRLWSVVITVYGDVIAPRGGVVWLGTLTRFFEALGIGEGAVRTAMSRLAADGWLERSRDGRKSFYRLGQKGRATFARATEHIYNPPSPPWSGKMQLLLLPANGERETARSALEAAGYGSPSPGLWMAAADAPVPDAVAGVALRLVAEGDDPTWASIAASAWPLERTAESYRRFTSLFRPLASFLDGGSKLSDLENLIVRVLLIHEYRRAILRDPVLPAELLPKNWPGTEARLLCANLYHAVLDASERWLDQHGVADGLPLPQPGPELRERFRHVQPFTLQKT